MGEVNDDTKLRRNIKQRWKMLFMYLIQGVRKAFSDKTFEQRAVHVPGKEHLGRGNCKFKGHETGKVWHIQQRQYGYG